MKKIFPKCHPYYVIDNKKVKNVETIGPAYTSEGYMLPCCWCDNSEHKNLYNFKFWGFFEEHLKVENNDNISDILNSSEWKEFHKMLIEEPSIATTGYKRKCSQLTNEKRIKNEL